MFSSLLEGAIVSTSYNFDTVSQSIKMGLKSCQTFTTILSRQTYLIFTNCQTRHNAHLYIETRCNLAWENIYPTIALLFQRSVEEMSVCDRLSLCTGQYHFQ